MAQEEEAAGREKLKAYMKIWDMFTGRRQKTMIMSAPELMELVDLLREVDEVFAEYGDTTTNGGPWSGYAWSPGGLRGQLEKLIGLLPGSLDTKRKEES